jgi:hypothetical protein
MCAHLEQLTANRQQLEWCFVPLLSKHKSACFKTGAQGTSGLCVVPDGPIHRIQCRCVVLFTQFVVSYRVANSGCARICDMSFFC